MDARDHQSPHIHPAGWLSGVYYASVPKSIADGDPAHSGWLELGTPPSDLPPPERPLIRRFRPEPGLLVLFPSYLYHRTIPFEDDSPRISIAFDIEPVRDAGRIGAPDSVD